MIKMMIKMNEEKLQASKEYTPERVYVGLDRIFSDFGFTGEMKDNALEYKGNGDARDFGKFGRIYNGLRKKSWFMDNVETWLLFNSDDVEDPEDYSVEDLLHYDGSRVGVSA